MQGEVAEGTEVHEEEGTRDAGEGGGPEVVEVPDPGEAEEVVEEEEGRAGRQAEEPHDAPSFHGHRVFDRGQHRMLREAAGDPIAGEVTSDEEGG